MKLSLVRRLQLKEEARKMDNMNNEDENMIQQFEDENEEGESLEMRKNNEALEQTEEDKKIEAEAMKRMRNMEGFPSLSNKNSGKEEINKKDPKYFEFYNVNTTPRNGQPYSFQFSLSVDKLAELYEPIDGQIFYDPSLQRGCTYDKNDKMKPLITLKRTKEILTSIVDGTVIHGGEILLSYAKEYPTPLSYNPETRTLSGVGSLAICDGGHRLESCRIWAKKYKRNPETTKRPQDFSYSITLLALTHDQAEQLFVEANTPKPVSKTRIAFHDIFNSNRKIVDIVENNSLLKGKIESMTNTISKKSGKIITFKTLLDNVSIFEAATPKQAEEVGYYLVKFWNELINLFPNSMGNVSPEIRMEQRSQNFVLENMFMNAYFKIAKEIIGLEDWKERLKKLTEDNFMSRENPIWRDILTTKNKIINSTSTNKIVFENMLKQINK